MEPSQILELVLRLAAETRLPLAACSKVPRTPLNAANATARTTWSRRRLLGVFIRDGFLDCYSGARLVFPGTLRALSILRPTEFPFHPNWKFGECHPAYWDLSPTIDHVIPIAAGGADEEANVVTTSMKANGAKSARPLAELGWRSERGTAHPNWDGLLSWFVWAWQAHDELRAHAPLRDWHRTAAEYAVDA